MNISTRQHGRLVRDLGWFDWGGTNQLCHAFHAPNNGGGYRTDMSERRLRRALLGQVADGESEFWIGPVKALGNDRLRDKGCGAAKCLPHQQSSAVMVKVESPKLAWPRTAA